MQVDKKPYTITVYSENQTGLLIRIVSVFTRRHINIESLTVSESSISGIHRFTISVIIDAEAIRKVVAQIDKQVDVLKAFYYDEAEIVYQEIALYKVPTKAFSNGTSVEQIIRKHNARLLEIDPEYVVLEKTGHYDDTQALLNELKVLGIFEFVRSGRVAIIKDMEPLNNYLSSVGAKLSSDR